MRTPRSLCTEALGAERLEVLTDEDSGTIIVAQLAIGGAESWLQADPEVPQGSGGKPIRMILSVPDPDAVFEQAISAGAEEINAVSEENGWRIGLVAVPDHRRNFTLRDQRSPKSPATSPSRSSFSRERTTRGSPPRCTRSSSASVTHHQQAA